RAAARASPDGLAVRAAVRGAESPDGTIRGAFVAGLAEVFRAVAAACEGGAELRVVCWVAVRRRAQVLWTVGRGRARRPGRLVARIQAKAGAAQRRRGGRRRGGGDGRRQRGRRRRCCR